MKFKTGDVIKRKGNSKDWPNYILYINPHYETIIILNINYGIIENKYFIAPYPETEGSKIGIDHYAIYATTADVDYRYDLDIQIDRNKKINKILNEV